MKRLIQFTFLGAIAASLVFTSCKDEEEGDPVRGQFTLGGQTYTLNKGELEDFGGNGNGSYDWDIRLTSSDVNVSEFSGTGNLVYLDLNTDSEDGLVSGTYTFAEEREEFTIVDASVFANFNFDEEGGTFYVDFIGGSVELTVSGNEVTVEFDLEFDEGDVSGSYTGTLED